MAAAPPLPPDRLAGAALARRLAEELGGELARRLAGEIAGRLASEELEQLLRDVLAGPNRGLFISTLAARLAAEVAERLARELRVEVGDKVVVRLGSHVREIDPSQLLDVVVSQFMAQLRRRLHTVVREAAEEAVRALQP